MKKICTITLLLATLVAGTALAGDMDWKAYGRVHVSTDLQNNGDESSVYVASNSTQIGFKGMFHTDNDLFDVIWQYESYADFNGEHDNRFSTRNSYAGLRGDKWGALVWGRYDTPFKKVGRKVEYFAYRIGDARNATSYFGAGWDQRADNMILYKTPQIAESLTFMGQFVPDEGVDDATAFSVAGMYEKDGLYVGAAFEAHGKALEPAYDPSDPENVIGETSTGLRASARYGADRWSLSGLFQTISNTGGYDGVSAMTFGVGGDYLVAPMWDLKAQFYVLDPNTDVDNDGANLLAVGVDYVLTEKARLYVAYATTMNEDDASWDPFHGGHGQSAGSLMGETPYGISVGLDAKW